MWVVTGFTLRFVPPDVSEETKREVSKVFEKVEQCGRWPETSLHDEVCLDSEERHERTSALGAVEERDALSGKRCSKRERFDYRWRNGPRSDHAGA